ncbi:hypothetical protein BH20ACT5_BH20ACT5_12670 [soil metagenome]
MIAGHFRHASHFYPKRSIVRRILSFCASFAVLAPLVVIALPTPVLAEPVTPEVQEFTLGAADRPEGAATVEPGSASPEGFEQQSVLRLRQPSTAPFSTLGMTWVLDAAVDDVAVAVRTLTDGVWSAWTELGVSEVAIPPNPAAVDARTVRGGTAPYWVGRSTGVEVEVVTRSGAAPRDLRLTLIDPKFTTADTMPDAPAGSEAVGATSAMPPIYTREQWGADESKRSWDPEYADTIKAATIHHTADRNDYTADDVAGMLRSIYHYHAVTQGWGDIGYNFLVDKFGRTWEGRYGGMASTVIGAHAGGWNTSTFGVSMIGNHEEVEVPEASMDAVAAVIAWKLALFGRDPQGSTQLTGGGSGTSKYPAGTTITAPVIFGHREVGNTLCPGKFAWARMAEFRDRVEVKMATEPTSPYPTGRVELTGHGYGHGRGMGQWGSYGYAVNYSWSHRQILSHFYGGTTVGTQANSDITVRLLWLDGRELMVTSGRNFTVGGVAVNAGSAARLRIRSDGRFDLTTRYSCTGSDVWNTVIDSSRIVSTVSSPGSDLNAMLATCPGGDKTHYRGELKLVNDGGSARTVNTLKMEDYLRGVVPRESPASWGDAGGGKGANALEAQSVAARSYAYSENRYSYAKTCDTTSCQVYSGAGKNGSSLEDRRTDAAITTTANEVLRDSGGRVVRAEFSSSTGGWSAGGQFPAVRDDGDTESPYHDWTDSISVSAIEAEYGVGQLTDFRVTKKNGLGADGGRALTVRITGTTRAVETTGDDVRSRFDLLSNWFTVTNPPPPAVSDYDGDGRTDYAVYRPSTGYWYIKNYTSLRFGDPGDVPVGVDYDGDGTADIAVFRPSNGTWYVRGEKSVRFGERGDIPVPADYNGDGKAEFAVFRPANGNWYVRGEGGVPYGRGGDIPVSANYLGDRRAEFAVFRPADGFWYVRGADPVVYGQNGDVPVPADFHGEGYVDRAVFRPSNGTWYVQGSPSVRYGQNGDVPVPGDYAGDGRAARAVFRPGNGTWYVRGEQGVVYGQRGDVPV